LLLPLAHLNVGTDRHLADILVLVRGYCAAEVSVDVNGRQTAVTVPTGTNRKVHAARMDVPLLVRRQPPPCACISVCGRLLRFFFFVVFVVSGEERDGHVGATVNDLQYGGSDALVAPHQVPPGAVHHGRTDARWLPPLVRPLKRRPPGVLLIHAIRFRDQGKCDGKEGDGTTSKKGIPPSSKKTKEQQEHFWSRRGAASRESSRVCAPVRRSAAQQEKKKAKKARISLAKFASPISE
jgi:hypothetical protein